MKSALYNKGLEALNKIHGSHSGETIVRDMEKICPDFGRMTIEWAFGEIMTRPALDLKTRELVIIASCVTLGHAAPQLEAHIEAALNVGATKEEIVEVILQMAIYAGFAAATNSFYVLKKVLERMGS